MFPSPSFSLTKGVDYDVTSLAATAVNGWLLTYMNFRSPEVIIIANVCVDHSIKIDINWAKSILFLPWGLSVANCDFVLYLVTVVLKYSC